MPDLPSPEAVEAAARDQCPDQEAYAGRPCPECLAEAGRTLSAAVPALRAQIVRELAEEAKGKRLSAFASGDDAGWVEAEYVFRWLSVRTETKE